MHTLKNKNTHTHNREAIAATEYETVLEHCASAIALDTSQEGLLTGKKKENRTQHMYNVHLYAGGSHLHLGAFDQAERSYSTATSVNPALKDAWQGLERVYRKQGISGDKLLTVLRKLMGLTPKGVKKWVTLASEVDLFAGGEVTGMEN